MLTLNSPIESIPKTTKPLIAALKKLGIFTVQDLLLYLPYRYLDFSKTSEIQNITTGENISLRGKIKSINSRFSFRGRLSLAEAVVSDNTGSIKVVWFNQPYLAKTLKVGDEVFLAGKAEYYKNTLQFTNPIYEKVSEFPIHTSRLVPVYHLKKDIYPKTFRNLVASVLDLANQLSDILPSEILKNQNLLGINKTIELSHFPTDMDMHEQAKKRLAFEEIFINQLAAQKHKLEIAAKKTYKIKFDADFVKNFIKSLPFKLTDQQKVATWDVLQDLEKPIAMNRLIEGDVGSGKTLVGLIAAMEAANQGYQAVFLAPTEILAQQHYETAISKFKIKNLKISLLTNSFAKVDGNDVEKNKLQILIKEGMPGIFIGTHALLQKAVKFKKLALVIIDEQHRFGVEQRSTMILDSIIVPHLLSLTATPIPRTLQLAFFGDLNISQIKQKPSDRKPIITKLFNDISRPKAYEFILAEIKKGRQAFVVTPLIEESDILAVKSAKKEQELLQKVFPTLQVGLLHGKLKAKEKEQVMADFLANKTQILVSTSVVEVGVDVPNASVMLIEGAERFGLAQLHQFRGRVGRSEHQSYCFLFPSNTTSPSFTKRGPGGVQDDKTFQRLLKFTETQDGFELAELDLKLRGFGDLYGASQSGINFKYFDPSYTNLITPAKEEAIKILDKDPELINSIALNELIKNKVIHLE